MTRRTLLPSETNMLARQLWSLQKLRPELFDYPKSARQMLRVRFLAGGDRNTLKRVGGAIESISRPGCL
jgi:hypothetical protein